MRWPSRARPNDPVAGLRHGDPEAMRAIHAELGPVVHGYLRQALRDPVAAEDVFQQVMTEVWRRGDQYDPRRASLVTWVMTIARSRAIDELRRRRPEPVDPLDAAFSSVPSADEAEALHDRWRVAGLLRLLPDDQADLLRMRFYEELSQQEIAERTGIPLGTIKTRMVRALERLRELFDEEDARLRASIGGPTTPAQVLGVLA